MQRRLLPEAEGQRRLLVDSNLLVLYIVGSVNIKRITGFKRTAKYLPQDHRLLTDVMGEFHEICTVPQVMTEVSNLTDMDGREKDLGREALRQIISRTVESGVSSSIASEHALFSPLGIADAAIASAARELGCMVLTDDLPLYVRLIASGLPAINFTHLRERFQIV
jgi:rRNA-processing protein FCF1